MHGGGVQSSLQSLAGRARCSFILSSVLDGAGAFYGRRADHDEDDDSDDGGGENGDDDICGDIQCRGCHEPQP